MLNVVNTQVTIRSSSYHKDKKIELINKILELDINGLVYEESEYAIKIFETGDEILYLVIPGKESERPEDSGMRPYDFRPELIKAGERTPRLGFKTMIEEFDNILRRQHNGASILTHMARMFYKMAFIEYHIVNFGNLPVYIAEDHDYDNMTISNLAFAPHYLYAPGNDIQDLVNEIAEICNMGADTFMYYCDILSWNEDVKYYYREIRERNGTRWNPRVGRYNNLLSYVGVLGFLLNRIPRNKVFNMLQKTTFSLTQAEIESILG